MDYQLTTAGVILRLDDNACIPKDETNADIIKHDLTVTPVLNNTCIRI